MWFDWALMLGTSASQLHWYTCLISTGHLYYTFTTGHYYWALALGTYWALLLGTYIHFTGLNYFTFCCSSINSPDLQLVLGYLNG